MLLEFIKLEYHKTTLNKELLQHFTSTTITLVHTSFLFNTLTHQIHLHTPDTLFLDTYTLRLLDLCFLHTSLNLSFITLDYTWLMLSLVYFFSSFPSAFLLHFSVSHTHKATSIFKGTQASRVWVSYYRALEFFLKLDFHVDFKL